MKTPAKQPTGPRWLMRDLRSDGFVAKFDEFKGGDVVLAVEGDRLTIRRDDGAGTGTLLGTYPAST